MCYDPKQRGVPTRRLTLSQNMHRSLATPLVMRAVQRDLTTCLSVALSACPSNHKYDLGSTIVSMALHMSCDHKLYLAITKSRLGVTRSSAATLKHVLRSENMVCDPKTC